MQAKDVMTAEVVTARLGSTVADIAELLLKHRISAVPVLDDADRVVGIVSEGDLVPRVGDDANQGSWWLRLFAGPVSPSEYIKRHGRRAEEVMTRNVISVAPETPLGEIARLLERKRIKRVPVIDHAGQLAGIISRANLLQGLAVARPLPEIQRSDEVLREQVSDALKAALGFAATGVNATVTDGLVELWGVVRTGDQDHAARLAAENVEGVRAVSSNLARMPPYIGAD